MKIQFFAVSLIAAATLVVAGCGKDEQPSGSGAAPQTSASRSEEATTQLITESTPSARTSALGEKYSQEIQKQKKLKNSEKSQNLENGCKVAQEVREAISATDRDGRIIDLLKSTESVEKLRGKKALSKDLGYVSARIMAFSKKLDQSCAKTKGVRGSKKAAFDLMQLVVKYKKALEPKKAAEPKKKVALTKKGKVTTKVVDESQHVVAAESVGQSVSTPQKIETVGHEDHESGMSMPGAQTKQTAPSSDESNMSVDPRELMSK